MAEVRIDFDGKALDLVRDAYLTTRDYQRPRNIQAGRDYLLYRAFADLTATAPSMPNITIPKIFSITETKFAQEVKAQYGAAPYIKFTSSRRELRPLIQIQNEALHYYLEQGGFFAKAALRKKIKTLFGTAFMEAVPYPKTVKRRRPMVYPSGAVDVVEQPVTLMCLRLRTLAPWEVYIDPYATDLETPEGCRYVTKVQLASKREIKKLAQQGYYPHLDVEKLDRNTLMATTESADFDGYKILADFGLSQPQQDGDIGLVMRYESPERYIDVWNGAVVLRETTSNPFDHGLCNLSRDVHSMDPHTQNQMWGNGEAKPNEMLQTMLNGAWSLLFGAGSMALQPTVFFRSAGLNKEDIIFGVGQRVPVSTPPGRPILDDVFITGGQPLTRDSYAMIPMIERSMDLTARQFHGGRGEADPNVDTATEVSELRQVGDTNAEVTIRNGEEIFDKDFGMKCCSIISQYGTIEDLTEAVGEEKAMVLYSQNPLYLPGPINLVYQGSNRVSNLLVRQRNLKELAGPVQQLLASGQTVIARKLMEDHEFDDELINDIMAENEQLFMQQAVAQQEQKQFDRGMQAEKILGQPGGRYLVHSQQQLQSEARGH